LAKGKLTLPILFLLHDATETQRTKLQKMVLNGEPMDNTILASIADYEGAIEKSIQTGKELLVKARKDLECLAESEYQKALVSITTYLDGLLDQCRGKI